MGSGVSIIGLGVSENPSGLSVISEGGKDSASGLTVVSTSIIDSAKGASVLNRNNVYVTVCDENDNPVLAEITVTGSSETDGVYSGYSEHPIDAYDVVNMSIEASLAGYVTQTIIDSYSEGTWYEIKIVLVRDVCLDHEITNSYLSRVRVPVQQIIDRGFKECCYENIVLASSSSGDYDKNDFTGFRFQKQQNSDTCTYKLVKLSDMSEEIISDNTFGEFKGVGTISDNLKLSLFIVEWKKVLEVKGEGGYRVIKDVVVGGISVEMSSDTYLLREFSSERADKTIRMDCVMDSTMVEEGVNFKNSGYRTSIRFKGMFGRRNPSYEQDKVFKRNYKSESVRMSQENEYELQSNLVPVCVTGLVYDFIVFGDSILVNDYNLINHSYDYSKFEVVLKGNKGPKYYSTNRNSKINLTFEDRYNNRIKENC